jgi:hypothetical protein
MELSIQNTVYQLLCGGTIGTILDTVFPAARTPGGLGEAGQVAIEIGAQLGLTLVFVDVFASTFNLRFRSPEDALPLGLALAGFQPGLLSKMGMLSKYSVQWYDSFSFKQSVPASQDNLSDPNVRTASVAVPPSTNTNDGPMSSDQLTIA